MTVCLQKDFSLLAHAFRSSRTSIAALLLGTARGARPELIAKHLAAAVTASIAANNCHGAHAAFKKFCDHQPDGASAVLSTIELPAGASDKLKDLASNWCTHYKCTPCPTAAAAAARPHPPAPDPPPELPPARVVLNPIAVPHASAAKSNASRVSQQRVHDHRKQDHATIEKDCSCGCAPSRPPAAPKGRPPAAPKGGWSKATPTGTGSDGKTTLECSLSLNLLPGFLDPSKFRAYWRDMSFAAGTARVLVHALLQVATLRELRQPGFGELFSWNISAVVEQCTHTMRPEYKPAKAVENR